MASTLFYCLLIFAASRLRSVQLRRFTELLMWQCCSMSGDNSDVCLRGKGLTFTMNGSDDTRREWIKSTFVDTLQHSPTCLQLFMQWVLRLFRQLAYWEAAFGDVLRSMQYDFVHSRCHAVPRVFCYQEACCLLGMLVACLYIHCMAARQSQ